MKAEYVNAFLVPSVRVLERMAQTEVRVGKISRLVGSLPPDALNIRIGLTGGLSGSVVLSLSRTVALDLVRRIGGDESSPEDVTAVLSELANTIVGNATGYLYELGLHGGITPPVVLPGSEASFGFSESAESILLPLETGLGRLDMIVSLAS